MHGEQSTRTLMFSPYHCGFIGAYSLHMKIYVTALFHFVQYHVLSKLASIINVKNADKSDLVDEFIKILIS